MSTLTFDKVVLTPFLNGLKNAHVFINKGYEHVQAQNIDPNDYLNARIHPDMKDFIFQVQRFTDSAKLALPRINPAIEPISLPDEEKTFPELLARIEKTIKYLENVDKSLLVGREDAQVMLEIGSHVKMEFTGLSYVQTYAQPNFWFHVTTAYALLRSKGVDVGKMDFLNGAKTAPPNIAQPAASS